MFRKYKFLIKDTHMYKLYYIQKTPIIGSWYLSYPQRDLKMIIKMVFMTDLKQAVLILVQIEMVLMLIYKTTTTTTATADFYLLSAINLCIVFTFKSTRLEVWGQFETKKT